MENCKHENKKRLYERGEDFKSLPIYKCQDCGELIEIKLKKVKVKKADANYTEGVKDETN